MKLTRNLISLQKPDYKSNSFLFKDPANDTGFMKWNSGNRQLTLRNIFLVFWGGFILSFFSFNNRFPLLTRDSGIHLGAGFEKTVQGKHTAIYGLFIACTSWGLSLWLVIFVQASMLSLLIFYFFYYFSNNKKYPTHYLAFIFIVTFFTAASIITSTIDIGIFACISILAVVLILLAENLKKRDLFLICAIAIVSIGTDTANLIFATLAILLSAAILLLKKLFPSTTIIQLNWKRTGCCFCVVFVSWLMVSSVHYAMDKKFSFIVQTNSSSFKTSQKRGGMFKQISIANYSRTPKYTDSYLALKKWFNWEFREESLSHQYFKGVSIKSLSYTQIISVVFCITLYVFRIFNKTHKRHTLLFIFSITGFSIYLIINRFLPREVNSQVWQIMWLLLLPAFLPKNKFEIQGTTL